MTASANEGGVGQEASACPTWLRLLGLGLAALIVAALLRLSNRSIPDPDSFYHLRHAALYAEKGLWMREFPWLVYSIVNRYSADVGYGFHVLLIPFTWLRDPVLGTKLAAVFETTAVMIMLYLALRRHRVAYDLVWPFMLLFQGPPMIYTFFMARPQTLTMGLSALLLSFLVRGGAWGVLLASAAVSFFHLNIVVIVPVVVVVVGLVKVLTERRWEWGKWAAALAGMGLGWVLRPNPLGVARLEHVQLIVHEVARQKKLPLLFGREWGPVSPDALSLFTYFLLIWVGVSLVFLVAAFTRRQGSGQARRGGTTGEDRTFLWSALALAVLFFGVAVLNTKRATPLWATFAVMFTAKAVTCYLAPGKERPNEFLKREPRLFLALSLAVIFALMVWEGVNQHLVQRRWPGNDPYRMRAAAEWLKGNSRPGEIVFNVDWGMFPELFFWNWQNRYVSGLDPIFLFAYDRELYWKTHHLATGEATSYTWASQDPRGRKEDTYLVLRRDLKASYIVLNTNLNHGLYYYLEGDPRFARRFLSNQVAIYQVRG